MKNEKETGKELAQMNTGTDMMFSLNDEKALSIMSKDAETYVDDTAADDIALPRLRILQSQSKQIKKSEAEFIKGAEEGDIFNTLTRDVIPGDQGVVFVPVKRRVVYLEWRDIEAGGGLLNNFGEDPTEYNKYPANEKGAHMTGPDTEIVKTYDTFGYLVDTATGRFSEVLLSMSKTQVKKMKRFNALIRSLLSPQGKTLPEYAGVYKLTTVPEKNDTNSWFNWEINCVGYTLAIPKVGESIYNAAKDFAKMIAESRVNVKYEQEEMTPSEETEAPESNEPM